MVLEFSDRKITCNNLAFDQFVTPAHFEDVTLTWLNRELNQNKISVKGLFSSCRLNDARFPSRH